MNSSWTASVPSEAMNRRKRKTWALSPVTRIAGNRKLYNRKRKAHDRYEDYGMGSFFVAE